MPKVSVIIPVYNVEKYLKKCLDSVTNQTLSDIEIICINDGSTDNSFQILKEYALKDNRIKIIMQKNQGQGIARNNAIDIANGEYLSFVDPDDWLELNALEILYFFSLKNDTQIVQFNYKEYKQRTKKYKNRLFYKKIKKLYHFNITKTQYYNLQQLKKGCLCNLDLHAWAHFYNSSFVKKNGIKFAPSKNGEDHLFTNGAKLLSDKIYYVNQTLYNYRCHDKSAVNTRSDENFAVFNNIKLMKNFIIQHNLWKELENEFYYYQKKVLIWQYNQTPLNRLEEYNSLCKTVLNENEYEEFINITHKKDRLKFYINFQNIFNSISKLISNRTYKKTKEKINA